MLLCCFVDSYDDDDDDGSGCLSGGYDHGNAVDDNDDDDRYDSVRLCKILTLTRTVVTIAAVLSVNRFL